MRSLRTPLLLALLLGATSSAQAGHIIAQPAGLASPDVVEDFGAFLFSNFTPITNQFPPLVFSHTAYFTTGVSNNLAGGFLTNDFSGGPNTFTIHFNQLVSDVSFVYHQISTAQPSVFRVYLGGVLVDSFSHTGDQFDPDNYYGFTDLLFDEVQVDFVSDFNIDEVAYKLAGGTGTAVCFGDGSGTLCPCGNLSAPGAGAGCLNGLGVGAVLSGSGLADTSNDGLVLTAAGVPAQPGMFFQGNNLINGGNGAAFGDGIRCCGANVVRVQIVPGQQPEPTSVSTSVTISTVPNQINLSGLTVCYQYWYRNPNTSPCGTSFNLSNALLVTWQ